MEILSDTLTEYTWNYRRVLGNQASYIMKKQIIIGIIDSGIDISNKYIDENIIEAESLLKDSSAYVDELGHGTQVFGVIDTMLKNVNYKVYKVCDRNYNNALLLVKAIAKAVKDGVNILNISMGIYKNINIAEDKLVISSFNKVIDYAKQNNVIIVASAGNNGMNMDDYKEIIHLPSDHDYVINVGSSTKDFNLAPYSNYGSTINLLAPTGKWMSIGKEIKINEMIITYGNENVYFKKVSDNNYFKKGLTLSYGTSLAPPHVVAAIAIAIDKNNFSSVSECLEYIYARQHIIIDVDIPEIRIV